MESHYFLCVLKLKPYFQDSSNWNPKTLDLVERHFKYLHSLANQGILLNAGRTDYPPHHQDLFGINILKALNKAEAEALVENDPAIKGDLMEATVHPYRLAVIGLSGAGDN